MPRFKLLNGNRVQLTAEEETQRDIDETKAASDKTARIAAKSEADAKQASGKAKLKELGLDDDELKQILGI